MDARISAMEDCYEKGKNARLHMVIAIAFAVLSLIAVIKALTENPFRIELFLGTIVRFMGSFLCAVFIPVGVLNLVFAFFFPNTPLAVSAGIMCAWLYFGGVICANVMHHWLGKKESARRI